MISLSGNDTIIIQGRVLTDLAGDVGELAFANEMVKVKAGKNGNTIYAIDASGAIATVKIRVLRGSDDDKFLNGQISDFLSDPPSFLVMDGQFVKRIGDGNGFVTNDTYLFGGGVPTRQVPATENVDGQTDQSVAVYELTFAGASRAIGIANRAIL